MLRRHVQPDAGLSRDHEQVVEQPALGRQQRAEPHLPVRHRLDILGDQTLQERLPIRPADRDQGPALEVRDRDTVRHPDNLGPVALERQSAHAYRD